MHISQPDKCARFASFLAALVLSTGLLSAQQAPAPAPSVPDQAAVAGPAPQEPTVTLDPFTVGVTKAGDYGATDSAGGSRINLPIVDVPMSIVTVTRALMDDIGADSYYGSLAYVSGMNAGSDIKNGDMVIRGVEVRNDSFSVLDGLPWGLGDSLQETEFLDRYEVVKGPAGTLYGDYSVGGLVNRIYKTPFLTPEASAKVTYSTFGKVTGVVDVGGPIDHDRQLSYRVVGVLASGEEVTHGRDDRHGVYITAQYIPKGGNTKFWVRGSNEYWQYNEDGPDALVDITGATSLKYFGAREAQNAGVDNEDMTQRYGELGATTTTNGLLGEWTSRFVARYSMSLQSPDPRPQNIPIDYTFYGANGANLGTLGPSPNTDGSPNPTFSGTPWTDIRLSGVESYWNGPNKVEHRGAYYDLTGAFDTGPFSHKLLIYGQFVYHNERDVILYLHLKPQFGGSTLDGDYVAANAYSLVHPGTWQGAPQSMTNYLPFTIASAYANGDYDDNTYVTSQFAAGAQDNMYLLNKRILLVGGARYDNIQNDGAIDNYAQVEGLSTAVTNWVYKGSAVFKPLPIQGFSLFLNYAQTFTPEYGTTYPGSGVQLKPLQGIAKEVGVKVELLDSSLVATVSYFHNILVNNPIFLLDPSTGRNIAYQNGTASFPGFDGDMTWRINENVSMLLGISDVNSLQPGGNGFRNAQIGFNWKGLVRYSFSHDTVLHGLSVGVGVQDIAKRYGSNGGYYDIAGYTNVDSFVTYRLDRHWMAQINVNNMTNVKAVLSALGQMSYNGAVYPTNVDFTVRYDY